MVSAFPPTSDVSTSAYPGEFATGRFAAGQLPTLLLLAVAAGLQLTRFGHRRRPLICAVAAGAGLFALVDSLRVYAFSHADPSGLYGSSIAHTSGAIPRATLAILVVLLAMTGVLRPPARPKPRPGPHALIALLLAGCAVVLTAVAVAIGPAIQLSRVHQLPYAVPMGSAVTAALVLLAAVLTRRPPVLLIAMTVAGSALLAGLVVADPLRYPLALAADVLLLAAAGVVFVGSRRPPAPVLPPPPPTPLAWPARPPFAQYRR